MAFKPKVEAPFSINGWADVRSNPIMVAKEVSLYPPPSVLKQYDIWLSGIMGWSA